MKKAIGFSIGILQQGYTGNPLFFHGPFSEIYQFTTFGTEWLGELLRNPGHRTTAIRAFYL
jgi:hypothetical protein